MAIEARARLAFARAALCPLSRHMLHFALCRLPRGSKINMKLSRALTKAKRVAFRYVPASFSWGVGVSGAAAIVMLTALVLGRRRR